MATNDQAVNNALDEVARKLGITREQALKVVVGKGLQDITASTGARAFTTGNQPAFSAGPADTHLIIHEATHVIQQATAKLKTR